MIPPYYKLPVERRLKAEQALREIKGSEMPDDVAVEKIWNVLALPEIWEMTFFSGENESRYSTVKRNEQKEK